MVMRVIRGSLSLFLSSTFEVACFVLRYKGSQSGMFFLRRPHCVTVESFQQPRLLSTVFTKVTLSCLLSGLDVI